MLQALYGAVIAVFVIFLIPVNLYITLNTIKEHISVLIVFIVAFILFNAFLLVLAIKTLMISTTFIGG